MALMLPAIEPKNATGVSEVVPDLGLVGIVGPHRPKC